MRVLCTFEVDIPTQKGEVSEMNDVYYEAWKAVQDAGWCWHGLDFSLKFIDNKVEKGANVHTRT